MPQYMDESLQGSVQSELDRVHVPVVPPPSDPGWAAPPPGVYVPQQPGPQPGPYHAAPLYPTPTPQQQQQAFMNALYQALAQYHQQTPGGGAPYVPQTPAYAPPPTGFPMPAYMPPSNPVTHQPMMPELAPYNPAAGAVATDKSPFGDTFAGGPRRAPSNPPYALGGTGGGSYLNYLIGR